MSVYNLKEPPFAVNAVECARSEFFEFQARTGDEVFYGARDENVAILRKARHFASKLDREAGVNIAANVTFMSSITVSSCEGHVLL